jgi:hypothetical protein
VPELTAETIVTAVKESDAEESAGVVDPTPDEGKPEEHEEDVTPEPEPAPGEETQGAAEEPSGGAEESAGDGEGDEIPPELLAMAEAVGFSQEDVEAFGSIEAANKAVALMASKVADLGLAPSEKPAEPAPPPAAPKTEAPKGDPLSQLDAAMSELDALKIDDEIDPSIKDSVERVSRAARAAIDAVKVVAGQVNASAVSAEDAQHRQAVAWFETKLAGKGKEWEAVFGAGGNRDLKPDSAEIKARSELWNTMFAMARGFASLGKEVSEDQLFDMALSAKFGAKAQEMNNRKLAEQVNRNAKRVIRRPSARNTVHNDPESAAVEAVDRLLKGSG